MSLRWKLVLALVSAVFLTTLLEGIAAKAINRKIASFGASEWLRGSDSHLVTTSIDQTWDELDRIAALGPFLLDDLERGEPAFQSLERPGWFWMIASNGVVDRQSGTCARHSASVATRATPRGALLCDGGPALFVSRAVGDGVGSHRLFVGRVLDQTFIRELGLSSGLEIALFEGDRLVASTATDAHGKILPLDFGEEQQGNDQFRSGDMVTHGYRGYLYGTQPFARGLDRFPIFSWWTDIPHTEGIPAKLVLWVPTDVMSGGNAVTVFLLIGAISVLPLLVGFALLVARRIAQPVHDLADAARRIADGDDVKAPANLTGELRDLGDAFDRMVSSLRDAQGRVVVSEKMAAVGQLAGGVAHEVNNPLGVILGFAQGMEKRLRENDPLHLPVTSIVREALRCKALVQELLVFSRTGNRHTEPVDLDGLVSSSATLLETRARTQGVQVVCEVAAHATVAANRTQLQQVIVNLGTNALDAMERGGKLTMRTRSIDHATLLEISDTGCGIDEKIRGRIFDPFFTTKGVGKGTGLGLSLVHEIVKQHHGSIVVDSVVGRGTTMTVSLPGAA